LDVAAFLGWPQEQSCPLLAASSTPASFAARAATKTLPIVFEIGFDPVEIGLVASLNRPGGNLTGVTNSGVEVAPRQLELLHELVPTAAGIALLVNPINRTLTERLVQDTQAAASKLGLQLADRSSAPPSTASP
jgi:putative ABC transport system substrate-binding protein